MCRETTSLNLAKLRGVTFVNQYVVIKYLGKGANGRVFLCLDMCDNRLYAVKVPKPHLTTSSPGSSYCVYMNTCVSVIPCLKLPLFEAWMIGLLRCNHQATRHGHRALASLGTW